MVLPKTYFDDMLKEFKDRTNGYQFYGLPSRLLIEAFFSTNQHVTENILLEKAAKIHPNPEELVEETKGSLAYSEFINIYLESIQDKKYFLEKGIPREYEEILDFIEDTAKQYLSKGEEYIDKWGMYSRLCNVKSFNN